MANRFWVGGSGNWNDTDTTHWSATSGGAGGASVPTASDDVFFNSSSGLSGATVSLNGDFGEAVCLNFTSTTGITYTISSSTDNLTVYKDVVLESGFKTGGICGILFDGTETLSTLTTNGADFVGGIGFLKPSGELKILDNISFSGIEASIIAYGTGTITFDNIDVKVGGLYFADSTVNLGSGTFECIGKVQESTGIAVQVISPVNLNCGTSTILITSPASVGAIRFVGGGETYNKVYFQRGSSTEDNEIAGSNTFADFRDTGTEAHNLLFTAGTTNTFDNFQVSGSSGKLITINSSASTATHALVKTGDVVSCDYLNIQHSVATPSDTWYAGANSTDNQADSTEGSGWIFTAPPSTSNTTNFFQFF
jgi:hypothetical protein